MGVPASEWVVIGSERGYSAFWFAGLGAIEWLEVVSEIPNRAKVEIYVRVHEQVHA